MFVLVVTTEMQHRHRKAKSHSHKAGHKFWRMKSFILWPGKCDGKCIETQDGNNNKKRNSNSTILESLGKMANDETNQYPVAHRKLRQTNCN